MKRNVHGGELNGSAVGTEYNGPREKNVPTQMRNETVVFSLRSV